MAVKRLVDRTAIVTGADQAVGRACVERLNAEGATVVAGIAAPAALPGASEVVAHDVTSPESWQRLVSAARASGGPCILVSAAQCFFEKPFLQTSLADVRMLSRANLVGPWLGMKEVVPAMRERGGGYIVNVTSSMGRKAHAAAPLFSALAGGLRMATKSAALEFARNEPRIIVNTVLVGIVDMPMLDGSDGPLLDSGAGPVVSPAEVAAAVAHLVSDDADYVTGMEIYADGGFAAMPSR